MKLTWHTFAGMRPSVAADKLPAGYAQLATNCRLLSGNLEPWKSLGVGAELIVKSGTIRSIYLMDLDGSSGGPYLLHHTEDVVYAPSPVAANTDDRTYMAGLDAPRFTTKALATDAPPVGSAGAYPYRSLLLGVPQPVSAPTLTVEVETNEPGEVTITNPGAESGLTGWTITAGDVVQATAQFHSGTASFQGGNASTSAIYQSIDLDSNDLIPGQTMELTWWQKATIDAASMGLEFYNASAALIGSAFLDNVVSGAAWAQLGPVTTIIPSTAVTVRVVQRYARTGGSGVTDAFIDDIEIIAATAALSYDGSSLDDWLVSGSATIAVDATIGWPAKSYKFTSNNGAVASMYRNGKVGGSPSYSIKHDWFTVAHEFTPMAVVIAADAAGSGTQISFTERGIFLQTTGSWVAQNSSSTQIGTSDYRNKRFTSLITIEDSGPNSIINVVTTNAGTGVAMEAVSTQATLSGDYIGFKGWNPNGTNSGWLDNIQINITAGTSTSAATIVYTNYVVIYLSSYGEKSKPSLVSRDVQAPSDNSSVTVTTITTAPSDRGITLKQIYRSVTASDGTTVYRLVVELPLATADYLDTEPDSELEEDILETDGWDAPDAASILLGIGANGIAFWAVNNQVFPSPINHPHAVLTEFAQNMAYKIIGGVCIDSDCYVVTQGFPQIITGSDPTALQPQKLEEGIGGLSGRSIVSMVKWGAVYASGRGLEYMNRGGAGLLTEGVLTEREWAAYYPSTITAAVYDGLYVGFYQGPSPAGFIFDPKTKSITKLDIYASAVFVDSRTGYLHLVVSNIHYIFNNGASLLSLTWQSPDELLPKPTSFECMRVFVNGTITARVIYDGTTIYSPVVTSSLEFLLPDDVAAERVSVKFEGTGTVKLAMMAEDMDEL